MSISEATVKQIAYLARLTFSEAELPEVRKELSSILNFIEQMDQIDTTGIPPMAHSLAMSQPLRADVVTEANQREKIQKLTPFTEAGLYLVPQVIE